jgi:uncharacterized protein (DUF58 family)
MLATVPLLGALSVVTGDRWLMLVGGACLGAVASALVAGPALDELALELHQPRRARVGHPCPGRVVVHNRGRTWSSAATVTQHVPGLEDVTFGVPPLAPGASAQVETLRLAVARAWATSWQAELVSSAPFGLVRRQADTAGATDLAVHPALVPHPVEARPAALGLETSLAVDRGGTLVDGVREWRPGDPSQRVHWRSTARRGQLVVVNGREPAGRPLVVLVAGPAFGAGWEPLVSLVASTAVDAVLEGETVTLVVRERGLQRLDPTEPEQVLDWCAALGSPEPVGATELRAAVSAAHGGILAVATTGAPMLSWPQVQTLAAGADVVLRRLLPPWPAGAAP